MLLFDCHHLCLKRFFSYQNNQKGSKLFTACLFTHVKEKVSKASTKHVGQWGLRAK